MRTRRAVLALSVAAVVGLTPIAAFARQGADDPKGHDARNDRTRVTRTVERRGHDDGPGHDRRRHVEPGDDHGRHVEPGDDHGRGVEPGDDHGRHGNEPGDDHGGR